MLRIFHVVHSPDALCSRGGAQNTARLLLLLLLLFATAEVLSL